MTLMSFRLRIALLSLLLSGSVLVGFSGFAWWKVHDAKIATLDNQIDDVLHRELFRNRDIQRWQFDETSLSERLANNNKQAIWVVVTNSHGDILYNSSILNAEQIIHLPWPASPIADRHAVMSMRNNDQLNERRPPPIAPPPQINFIDKVINGKKWRVGLASTPEPRLGIAVGYEVIDEEMRMINTAFFFGIPSALLLIGLAAWFLSHRALQPIQHLTNTMQTISSKALNARMDEKVNDKEFSQLISVFNDLLSRLERSFQQAIRFSGDAAHELKTPLAIIQGQLELAIQQAATGSAIQKTLTDTLDEVRRLSVISRKLLLLSQADAGKLRLHRTSVSLSQLLIDLVEDAQLLAPHLSIKTTIASDLSIEADTDLLYQALQNLISNAIKYNTTQGWITIRATQKANRIEIDISNSSHGIPQELNSRLFERFTRGDASHNRQIEGFGLGLSLAQEIIKAHGGSLTLSINKNDETGFLVSLPNLG